MMKIVGIALNVAFVLLTYTVAAQKMEPFELSDEWLSKIEGISPERINDNNTSTKKILIFSLYTGFEHWTIPHTEAVIKLIAEKSCGLNVETSTDIRVFEKKNLKKYDAVVLNNNCSGKEKRNLFWDVLKTDDTLDDNKKLKKAQQLEKNLLNYVKKGNGLMVLHGAVVMLNRSKKFSEMLGGSFDYHPKQQPIQVKLADPEHPMVQTLDPKGFEYIDEPYFFKNAYFDYNFRPLLYMDADELDGLKEEDRDKINYISWIKRHGKGKVFYSSPSHNAQSMENPQLLKFFQNGLRYVTGYLNCDDSPIGRPPNP